MRSLVLCCLVAIGLGFALPVLAGSSQSVAGDTLYFLGNRMNNVRFEIGDQQAYVVDSLGQKYPLIVRSRPVETVDPSIYNPAMPDWSDAAANAARDSLDHLVKAVGDRLLEAGATKSAVAESLAVLYRASPIVAEARPDSSEVSVLWRSWRTVDHKLIGHSQPLPSKREQLTKWLAPILAYMHNGELVMMGEDCVYTHYDARLKLEVCRELDDLRMGRTPQTHHVREKIFRDLAIHPTPLTTIRVPEER